MSVSPVLLELLDRYLPSEINADAYRRGVQEMVDAASRCQIPTMLERYRKLVQLGEAAQRLQENPEKAVLLINVLRQLDAQMVQIASEAATKSCRVPVTKKGVVLLRGAR